MRTAGLIAQMVVGVVFLVAGLPKTWDPALFYWDAVPFTLLFGFDEGTAALLARLALVLGPVECVLGVALMTGWRRRVVFPAATALMAFFTVLVTMAWMQGYDASCGCFGTLVERGAGEAVVEDLLLLGLTVLGWVGTRGEAAHTPSAGTAVALTAVACLLIGLTQVSAARDRIEDSDLKPGVSLGDLPTPEGLSLAEGKKLLLVLTPTCSRCRRAVPRINTLADADDLPDVIGLTYDSPDLDELRETLKPTFPILTVSKTDFMRLAWGHGVPRMALLKDGVVERVWEAHALPTRDELR